MIEVIIEIVFDVIGEVAGFFLDKVLNKFAGRRKVSRKRQTGKKYIRLDRT